MLAPWDYAPMRSQPRLLRALLVSIACHGLFLTLLPGPSTAPPRAVPVRPVEVRLLPAPLPSAVLLLPDDAGATPQAVAPRAPPRLKQPPARRVAMSTPIPREARSEPLPAIRAASEDVVAALAPVELPPPAAPVQPAQPEPASDTIAVTPSLDQLMHGYALQLERVLGANQHYPRIARQRQWQGLVKMRVSFLPGGQIGQVAILSSSGFAVLDETALDMVRSADLPPTPDPLRQREFTLDVPVLFRLRG